LSVGVKSPLQCDDWNVYRSVHQMRVMKDNKQKRVLVSCGDRGSRLRAYSWWTWRTQDDPSQPGTGSQGADRQSSRDGAWSAVRQILPLSRKKVEFFSDVLSRTRGELETQDLSTVLTDKLFAMYAHIYREA